MAVVLHVLAVIGIVLLWILLVLAVLIALILLVPFRYRGQVKKQGDAVDAKGTVWWLFHVFHLSGYFRRTEGKNDKGLEIYLFGIPVYSLLKKHKKNKLKKTPKTAKTSGKPGSHRAIRKRRARRRNRRSAPENGRAFRSPWRSFAVNVRIFWSGCPQRSARFSEESKKQPRRRKERSTRSIPGRTIWQARLSRELRM